MVVVFVSTGYVVLSFFFLCFCCFLFFFCLVFFCFQAEDGIRDLVRSRGLGDVYKRQAESRPAEEVVTILNELFSILSEIVFRHEGTVDKFIGDCIMAVWGAPQAQPDHAQRALADAQDIQRLLENAHQMRSGKYANELSPDIRVNNGEALVGNIGSDKHTQST